jgi:two-component system cell cycle sensor histidine kinase/response regulator CckA
MATILVVDDEPPIRQLVARILERKGHTVIQCGDATTALTVTEPLDLLIVDFVLPDINGRELTAQLRETRPTLPVILMSGYLPDPELAPPPPSTFMQKPMTPTVVIETVDAMLGDRN